MKRIKDLQVEQTDNTQSHDYIAVDTNLPRKYVINYDNVKTVDDVIVILKAMDLEFTIYGFLANEGAKLAIEKNILVEKQ